MITETQVEDLFERARELYTSGRAAWDVDDLCRWSYFFIDSSRNNLIKLSEHLKELEYELVGFLEPGPEDDDQQTIYLRADKVEKHTVASLLSRNAEFYALAKKFKIADYDGMDSGAVDGP